MYPLNVKNAVLAVCLGCLVGLSAAADDTTEENEPNGGDEWEFTLTPLFLWGVSLKGDSTVGGQQVPLNIEFKDGVLENLTAVFTVHFEAHKGKAGLFAEYQYVDLDPSAQIKNGPTVKVGVINQLAEIGGTYTLWGEGRRRFEVLGGIRWYDVNMDVKLKNGFQIGKTNQDWLDGFVGGRLWWDLSPKWTFIGRADIGAGDSDLVWNLAAQFDYRHSDLLSFFAGWRTLDVDYSTGSGKNEFAWDIRQQGPLAGLSIHW